MSRKVTEEQKKSILKEFNRGLNVKDISKIYNFTIATINRQLRNMLGEENFLKIKNANLRKNNSQKIDEKKNNIPSFHNSLENHEEKQPESLDKADFNVPDYYVEISPLIDGVEFENQKDISSIPINKANFPKVLFLISDSKNELDIKPLRHYPKWDFLAPDEQNRMTIEIFSDQKIAKKVCSINQKLIKIPNPKVLEIASKKLKEKGITRIIYEDNLLSL